MHIRIVNYFASIRDHIQAFVDIEIDGWLRFSGIHLQRDGTLRSAQLTPMRKGRRAFLPAVEVVDPDLRELLTAEILAAIHQHLETLPPEKRMRPPQPIVPRAQPGLQRAPETPAAALHPQPTSAKPLPLPPPRRLLVDR
jgi:hypothetical protein